MSTAHVAQSIGNNPDNEGYESDALEDSESEGEGDNNSKGYNLVDDDDEEYGNFLRSVFCDDDGAKSVQSQEDEEDEEDEYRPQQLDSNDDDDYDDDDDGDDDGLICVARRELEDLVDGCWQTIAGEPLLYGPSSFDPQVGQKRGRGGVRRGRGSSMSEGNEGNSFSGLESTRDADSNSIALSVKSSKVPSPRPSREGDTAAKGGNKGAQGGAKGPQKGQSLISNLVRQIFSGEKPSAVCLDGMPVDAIRKLVARQMSMASQLLVQMLLSSEDRSGCFSSCYTSLMELSNYRENALKKSALMQMNMKNLRVAAFQKIAQFSQPPSDGLDSSPAEMRLTRAVAERQSKTLGASMRSTSLFDVPMLADITELFGAIDLSRREIKAQIDSASATQPQFSILMVNSSSAATIAADQVFRKRSEALVALKVQMQQIAASSLPSLSSSLSSSLSPSLSSHPEPRSVPSVLTKMRVWECLIPTSHSPLGEDMMLETDPSSLMGRSLFTPAEDDLLLRGIIKHGEDAWGLIKQQFLPSKEEQLLQFRFRQMTSPAAKEASKFKRYTALEKSCRTREQWTHEEDLDLLRGYQIYGDKWPLISIFFFPHRCRKELKTRWQAIQKHWERSFSGNLDHITFKTELAPSSKMLLHFLKESNSSSMVSPKSPPAGNRREYAPETLGTLGGGGGREWVGGVGGVEGVEGGREKKKDSRSVSDRGDKGDKGDKEHRMEHRIDDGVEEDALADSDEEHGEQDLDWHLGRLSSRQSVLSQWSRTLSSTAAQYGGAKKPTPAPTPRNRTQGPTQGPPMSRAHRREGPPQGASQGLGRQQHQQQQQPNEVTKRRGADSISSPVTIDRSPRTTRSATKKTTLTPTILTCPSASRSSRQEDPPKILEGLESENIPGESSFDYAESQGEFTNFSNITMILDNARALMEENKGKNGNKHGDKNESRNGNENGSKNKRGVGGLEDIIDKGSLPPPSMSISRSQGGNQGASQEGSQGGRGRSQMGRNRPPGPLEGSAKPPVRGPVRGLFAAVMKDA